MGLHVVIGASGGIGSALVDELLARGHRVRAVTRGHAPGLPADVEHLRADAADPGQARGAVRGAAVVVHAAQPEYTRWAEDFPPLTRSIARATAAAGARLVMADNLYMYGPHDGPLTEQTPQRPPGPKGRVRRDMAAELLHEHERGRLRVTLGRASDYFGPRGTATVLGDPLFAAAVAGGPVQWIGRLDQPHTVHFLPDVARGLAVLAEREEADGRAWHLPAGPAVSGHRLLEVVGEALGHPVAAVEVDDAMLAAAAAERPLLGEVRETMYMFEAPFVADASAFERRFGPLPPTPLAGAVAATCEWFAARARGDAR